MTKMDLGQGLDQHIASKIGYQGRVLPHWKDQPQVAKCLLTVENMRRVKKKIIFCNGSGGGCTKCRE
jgi:hypothetical protein